jgi:hypothetical protein
MIKQLLFTVIAAASFAGSAIAQCTPNEQYADSTFGVWPDTTTNLPCAFADNASGYNATIDLKTLTDTAVSVTVSGLPIDLIAYIEAFRINSVDGLPAGFNYIPNQSVWTNGGTSPNFTAVQGCVSILAAQSALTDLIAANPTGIDIPLTVVVDAKIKNTNNALANLVISNAWLSDLTDLPGITAISVEGYKLRVRPVTTAECGTTAVAEIASSVSIDGNYPNPFSKTTSIRFNSSSTKNMELKVFNMVGKEMMKSNFKAVKGENSYTLLNEKLTPGVYFYTLSDGKNTATRRMIVSAN